MSAPPSLVEAGNVRPTQSIYTASVVPASLQVVFYSWLFVSCNYVEFPHIQFRCPTEGTFPYLKVCIANPDVQQ